MIPSQGRGPYSTCCVLVSVSQITEVPVNDLSHLTAFLRMGNKEDRMFLITHRRLREQINYVILTVYYVKVISALVRFVRESH